MVPRSVTSFALFFLFVSSAYATTARTYHIFPQVADGYFPDGSYYQSSVLVTNSNPGTATPSCTILFHGLTINGQTTWNFTVSGAYLYTTPGTTQAIQAGYASLTCTTNVDAQLLYASYNRYGTKLSEATVFSSPSATSLRLIADESGGSQLGLAIANDSTQFGRYTINVYNNSGGLIGSPSISVAAGQSYGAYLDQLLSMPANNVGIVEIDAQSGTASVIGLRFTGYLFTTIPAAIINSTSATAATYHVFPDIADGYFPDGSYYQSSVLITNSNPGTRTPMCTLQFHGLTVRGQTSATFTVGGSYIYTTPGTTQAIQAGYASLACSTNVEAQLLYTSYTRSGTKLSEATVFSSPPATWLRLIGDERGGTQLGVAIANDSNQTSNITIRVYNSSGILIGQSTFALFAGQNYGGFLDQIVPTLANNLGIIDVVCNGGTVSVIGLRYTGYLFTTIPAATIQ